MNTKRHLILAVVFFSAFIALCICLFVLIYNQPTGIYEQHTEEVYGNIQFKGKVLKIHKIHRWGRIYGIMCVKLDYTNVDDFYKFDDMTCLKIKNGILSLPVAINNNDGYDKYVIAVLSASYIEVNMDNSRQMAFIDSLGNRFVENYLYYRNGGLTESDMRLCDGCEGSVSDVSK
jgi:hypothetical protein